MTWIADLHIHSRFSRATSGDCDAPHLDMWARNKGISLVGTGDFTHPEWRRELKEMLREDENGFYALKEEYRLPCLARDAGDVRFAVTGEISTIYKRDGKTRKVHHVIVLPGLEEAEDLAHRLEAIGNLHSDGRPILGLDSRDLLEIVLESCPEAIYIPAHIWTPHFSLFGAFSGFNSVEECYGDLSRYVHAMETGLSSDPPMNRRLSALDGHVLVSNSDAHSPAKLGREANLLSCAMDYPSLKRALDTGEGMEGTIEFFPEEGKYHLDGHRNCHCCLEPEETARLGGVCPVCGKKLTVGVLSRARALADREQPGTGGVDRPFESLIPLTELAGETLGVSAESKKAKELYGHLLRSLGPEFSILRERHIEEIAEAGGFLMGEAVGRLREGRVIRQGGFDGEYGVIRVFQPGERETLLGQTSLLGAVPLESNIKKEETGEKNSPAGEAPDAGTSNAQRPNAEQEEAIRAEERVVAVSAGPGTGKTGTLVNRIAWLLEEKGVPPREITAVTFTRQAAGEMLERLEKRFGKKRLRGITVGTFHAICLGLIEKRPIISRENALEAVEALLKERKEKLSASEALRLISARKNGMDAPGLPEGLAVQYAERLRALGVRDLDDVLLEALQAPLAGKKNFHYLLVDEYQDINPVQRELVNRWSRDGELFVIGDPDQSIYGFRGAQAGCFEELESAHPGARMIRLKQNYRSTPEIIACAVSAISPNPGRARALMPALPSGEPVRWVRAADEDAQYIWIAKEIARLTGGVDMLDAKAAERGKYAFSEIAVLCRTHRQLEQMERCLNHDGIPCAVAGRGDCLSQEKNQALIGFFSALETPEDGLSLSRALKSLWRCPEGLAIQACQAALLPGGMGGEEFERALAPYDALEPFLRAVRLLGSIMDKEKPRKLLELLCRETDTLGRETEQLLNTAVFYDSMASFLAALRMGEEGDIQRLSGGKPSGAVRLMTLHGAKGLEFPAVFLAGADEGRLPLKRAEEAADEQEERRLFFVGITRARRELVITSGPQMSSFFKDIASSVLLETAGDRKRIARTQQISFLDH